jgi:hypothetical protein
MSARSFRSVFMVASCAGAALGCYLVSLRVASERAALEQVETEIVLAQRDIRLLQTEIGTRGRLAQLERWNVKVLALSAPSADQFLDGGFALAKMVTPHGQVDLDAPVVLAEAPAPGRKPQLAADRPANVQAGEALSARDMMHVASIKRQTAPVADTAPKVAVTRPITPKPLEKTVAANKPAEKTTATKVAAPAKVAGPAKSKLASTARAKPATSDRQVVAADPLAPLASSNAKPKKVASASPSPRKDNGSKH